MMSLVCNAALALLTATNTLGAAQVGPPGPPNEAELRQQIERQMRILDGLRREILLGDGELRQLLAGSEERLKGYQKQVDETEQLQREVAALLARVKGPRVRLPRTGLAVEYRRMVADERRDRCGP